MTGVALAERRLAAAVADSAHSWLAPGRDGHQPGPQREQQLGCGRHQGLRQYVGLEVELNLDRSEHLVDVVDGEHARPSDQALCPWLILYQPS